VSSESLRECKTKNRCLVDEVQSLQAQLSDSEMRCSELDSQLKHAH